MKIYVSCLLFLVLAISTSATAIATNDVDSTQSTIVVIDSMEPGQSFQVSTHDLVRIPASVVAGSSISAKISGPAEIVAHNRIVPMKENTGLNGEKTLEPLLGTTEHEFVLQPTGAGEVTLTLTTRSPIPRIEPVVKTYHFRVR